MNRGSWGDGKKPVQGGAATSETRHEGALATDGSAKKQHHPRQP